MNLINFFKDKSKETLLWDSKDKEIPVQVWERGNRRELRFGNKVIQSVVSLNKPNYLILPYTRSMLFSLIFCPKPNSILHIGLGGGSIARWFHSEFNNVQQSVIEVNKDVIKASYRFFKLPRDKRLHVINGNASKAIKVISEKFDLIFLDAFDDFGAPVEVKEIDFLRSLNSLLTDSGIVVGNYWTLTGDFKDQCDIWGSIFRSVYNLRANKKGNEILFGFKKYQNNEENKFKYISKILEKRYLIEFNKMNRNLKKLF